MIIISYKLLEYLLISQSFNRVNGFLIYEGFQNEFYHPRTEAKTNFVTLPK